MHTLQPSIITSRDLLCATAEESLTGSGFHRKQH